ncbi:hypothetical protein HZH68_002701 [Vespula germanica]|uniref:Uncharacterized protein n=1 Tax=Vespula germanica TaxID=30212 RepID=A0A834NMT8_VESGE|nr:hypothetical protein HZH68_002701 [Vespula germanica]
MLRKSHDSTYSISLVPKIETSINEAVNISQELIIQVDLDCNINLIFNHDKEWNIDPNNNSDPIIAIMTTIAILKYCDRYGQNINYKRKQEALSSTYSYRIVYNLVLVLHLFSDITMDLSFTFMFFHGDGAIDTTSFSSSLLIKPALSEIFILNRVQRKVKNHPETGELSQYYANF